MNIWPLFIQSHIQHGRHHLQLHCKLEYHKSFQKQVGTFEKETKLNMYQKSKEFQIFSNLIDINYNLHQEEMLKSWVSVIGDITKLYKNIHW
ncbi:hypothetical protein M9Y10_008009 [Tritrichomonas musculus]|uniref:Uncharacterized protein n=1 Tax=Tritrichomonas musculus TaxID=1915356 RepID=A0ABR2J3V7_9EUKA